MYPNPVKKLRFIIGKLQFSDLIFRFHAEPGERTEIALSLSRSRFVKLRSENLHNDCIAFSQLLKIKGIDYSTIRDERASEALSDDFVVVSFERWKNTPVRLASRPGCRRVTAYPNDLAELLFVKGFSVRSDGPGQPDVHYVRFAGSASMTRNGAVLFVNAAYEPDLSQRVTLGLEEEGCLKWAKGLIPSKWDAYKGLCLSDGYGLEWLKQRNPGLVGETVEMPVLNGNTFAVIQDLSWARHGGPRWQDSDVRLLRYDTEAAAGKDNAVRLCEFPETVPAKPEGKAQLSDGVGLIDPAAARWLSAALCGEVDAVHSFQIRMPFMKGMLHSVDFRGYLQERGVTKIKDAWGTERDVSQLQILIPSSMFKAKVWFGRDAQAIQRYFDAFLRYGHDLFLTQRHLPRGRSAEPYRLNYEVLQTCGLSNQDFDALLDDNLKRYERLCTDEDTRIQYFLDAGSEEEDGMDEDAPEDSAMPSSDEEKGQERTAVRGETEETDAGEGEESNPDLLELLSKAISIDPRLVRTRKAKDILTDACSSMALNKILRGRLALGEGAHGESRYLSCDLGRFLDYLVTLDAETERKSSVGGFDALSPGEFYAPGFSAKGRYCALFRTPHYARNEHLVLRPRADAQRDRYFGKLTGVLMLPAEGFGPQRLGGADFDGDHVAVIDDGAFVRSLERALGLSGLQGRDRDRLGGSGLPFIEIPSDSRGTRFYDWDEKDSPDENRERLAAMEFQSFLAGKNNQVGLFSNYAFSHGVKAYGSEEDRESQRMVQCFTALTGLEIDSVKTGRKPVLPKGAKIPNGLFLTIAQDAKYASKQGEKTGWTKKTSGGFALGEELKEVEKEAVCNMDKIPSRLWEVCCSLSRHRNPGIKLAACFPCLDCLETKNALCQELHRLNQAFAARNRTLKFERKPKRRKSAYYDLARVLSARCSDLESYEELYERCVGFFRGKTDAGMRERICHALEHSFELANQQDREGILLEALEREGIIPGNWSLMREQFTDFRREGFTLPYILLRMTDEREERYRKQKQEENPYWNELSHCPREEVLSKTRAIARNLCRKYYPSRNDDEISAILAAHLLKNDSESFFWSMLGTTALTFLRKGEECCD